MVLFDPDPREALESILRDGLLNTHLDPEEVDARRDAEAGQLFPESERFDKKVANVRYAFGKASKKYGKTEARRIVDEIRQEPARPLLVGEVPNARQILAHAQDLIISIESGASELDESLLSGTEHEQTVYYATRRALEAKKSWWRLVDFALAEQLSGPRQETAVPSRAPSLPTRPASKRPAIPFLRRRGLLFAAVALVIAAAAAIGIFIFSNQSDVDDLHAVTFAGGIPENNSPEADAALGLEAYIYRDCETYRIYIKGTYEQEQDAVDRCYDGLGRNTSVVVTGTEYLTADSAVVYIEFTRDGVTEEDDIEMVTAGNGWIMVL